jgi:hypothetical protein
MSEGRLLTLAYQIERSQGVKLILPPLAHIPGGRFLLRSGPQQDPESEFDEWPQHTVTVDDFFIAKYPPALRRSGAGDADAHRADSNRRRRVRALQL